MSVRLTVAAAVAAIALAAVGRAQRTSPASGFDPATFDQRVRPQDDLYRFVNGRWLDETAVPDDRVSHSASTELVEKTTIDLRLIVDEWRAKKDRRPGSPEQQVVDLYTSMVDEAAIEARGLQPLEPMLRAIDAIDSPHALAQVAGEMSASSTAGPFFATLGTHPRDPAAPAIYLSQGGLLLDRDHYLSAEAASVAIRREYETYLARIFTVSGRATPAADASAVVALEIELARAHVAEGAAASAALSLAQMRRDFAGFDWQAWARPQGIDRVGVIVVAQPAFFRAFAALVPGRPWTAWRAWLAARYLTALSPFVSNALGDARFEFFGRILSGQVHPIPRWKRAISLINATVGDTIGRDYVARHLTRASRDHVRRIVDHIVRAYGEAIDQASWLGPAARGRAKQKISALITHVGSPDVWRDYRGLEIRADDLAGNIARGQQFDNARRMAGSSRTGGGDWPAPPQTVNAYYVPARNEVVIPAAMLQPPFFDAAADDAMNYGAIGAVIGHEIGHALAQEGWTAADRQAYVSQAQILLDQLNGYRLRGAPDLRLNGMMAVSETLGDLSGLSVAWRAWQRSTSGAASPVIDGLTGDQRFFLAWARIWRTRERPEYARQIVLTSRHAPAAHRANAMPGHLDAFYRAFGVRETDGLFIPPARRARLF